MIINYDYERENWNVIQTIMNTETRWFCNFCPKIVSILLQLGVAWYDPFVGALRGR